MPKIAVLSAVIVIGMIADRLAVATECGATEGIGAERVDAASTSVSTGSVRGEALGP